MAEPIGSGVAGWAELIKAIASLLWPLSVFALLALLYHMKNELLELARRIKKIKIAGQELEMDELKSDLEKLRKQTAESNDLPDVILIDVNKEQNSRDKEFQKDVLKTTAYSPKAALLLLSAQLESNIRELLEATGWHDGRHNISMQDGLRRLNSLFPDQFPTTFDLFLKVRNKIAHGSVASDDDVISAIDSGLTLIEKVQAVPRESNTVYDASVTLYSDPECKNVVSDAKGVLLETTSPDGSSKTFRIFPTTRNHFEKGQRVAWEWNMSRVWPETWYKNPESGAIEMAWGSSAEFVGKALRR